MFHAFAFLAAVLLTAQAATGAEAIVGRASIIDGDTVEIHGKIGRASCRERV